MLPLSNCGYIVDSVRAWVSEVLMIRLGRKGSIQIFLTEITFLIKSQFLEIKQSVHFKMNTTTFMWNNLIFFLDKWQLFMNSPQDDGSALTLESALNTGGDRSIVSTFSQIKLFHIHKQLYFVKLQTKCSSINKNLFNICSCQCLKCP